MPQKTQTFNDGVANIYSVANIAPAGNMSRDGLTLKVSSLRYKERTVGMSRFWTAKQTNAKIIRLLRMPKITTVSSQDIIIPTDGEQYKVLQVQYPEDIYPPVMDLSLERIDARYDIAEP
ncbi:hypothetical protein A7W90_16215 [Clostridium sp. Bc-iso-3]|nr:hypothetical protein A7W90_16215 [Clostridium sp. Bc-iso-3]